MPRITHHPQLGLGAGGGGVQMLKMFEAAKIK